MDHQRMSRKTTALSSLKAELQCMDHSEFPIPRSCCIYRVPPQIRAVNEAAYTPMMVSIGPFHHGNKIFNSMEEVKLWFLHKFLKRAQNRSFDYYVDVLRNQETQIRRCYSEIIPIDSDEFLRMILTDACFMIEYFLLWLGEDCWHPVWSIQRIKRDLILLENQLPFFVLKGLFEETFPNGYGYCESSIEYATYNYFYRDFMLNILPNRNLYHKFTFEYFQKHHLPRPSDGTPQVLHLCDMLRICYVRLDEPQRVPFTELKPVHSACKLHDAGMKFVVDEGQMSLLKLQYSKGVLKIPGICIDDSTEIQLRNVVAFEQCHIHLSRSMCDYILFLEYLIRTGKDVEVLAEKGVIQNIIGESDAVASMTKGLGRHTSYTYFNYEYLSLFEELNKFSDNSCHKYKAIFKQQYWSTPWRIASLLGAILLLFLTLIQTISSVISLFQN